MQFKHPEILYALLLLIIPILVHLFQLQRFIKVPFTNVKILKTIEKQTRKSARLKKWLILITRLLIFTCIIFAFAQPYLSHYSTQHNFNTTIYVDNSFSMQVKGEKGELLQNAVQDIIENNSNSTSNISLITNNQRLKNLDAKSLKNKLITLKYHPIKLNLNTALLKAKNIAIESRNTTNKIILISDFQNINYKNDVDFSTLSTEISFVKLTPKKLVNFYVDSVYISKENSTVTTIEVLVKSSQNSTTSIPVSLFNSSKLIGKSTSKFNNSTTSTIHFTIPNSANFNGKVSIRDDTLEFDNDFYFSISKPKKINVLSIGKTSNFLAKIYTKNEFNYTSTPLQNLNYNNIQKQHLILLNELENIPKELTNSMLEFSKLGGSLVLIPAKNSNLNSYNSFLSKLNIGIITSKIEDKHKITTINYGHPLLADVFEKKVKNFQYPITKLHYKSNLKNSSAIIKLDNYEPYISSTQNNNSTFYWVSAPLNKEISNFIQSPLVVPVFYNFAKSSLKISQLYYTISPEIKIDVLTTIGKDNVLKISNEVTEFIPLQSIAQNKVTLKLQENILKSGFYTILNGKNPIKTIAFNYNREESDLNYLNLKTLIGNHTNITISSSIGEVLNKINNEQKINWLFKWFLAFSILFLLIEMLILKYFNK
ncbi:MAG: BatA domain-containing protein [Lutibacter sp.]|uniref:BatA domain-containing protein n=1 Tax=Lutibacter sp. TaxID=1925666 RepID=UPI00385833FC